MGAFNDAIDAGMEALEELDPQTVRLSIAPTVDVAANIGQFRRQRVQVDNGYQWVEAGTITIRRASLAAAGIEAEPDSGQKIQANGKTYKIKFCCPDSSGYTLDCVNIY